MLVYFRYKSKYKHADETADSGHHCHGLLRQWKGKQTIDSILVRS